MIIALLSALTASSCCWLPLVLIAFGAGSAAAAIAYIEPYRVPVSILALCALAVAFYYTYRKPKTAAEGGGDCCSAVESCCSPERSGSIMKTINKIMLWAATAFVLLLLFFPEAIFSLLAGAAPNAGSTADITSTNIDDTERFESVTIGIEGMT